MFTDCIALDNHLAISSVHVTDMHMPAVLGFTEWGVEKAFSDGCL